MESLVARMEEVHHRDLKSVRGEVQQLADNLKTDETVLDSLGKRIAQIEQIQTHQSLQASIMQLRYEELEDRNRRKNLRFRGVPEAVEKETLEKTIQAICLQVATRHPSVF